jgi:hypothetical protein
VNKRLISAMLAGLALGCSASAVAAATQCGSIVWTPSANAPSLGKIVRGGSATTFQLPTAGPVTTVSGDAILLHPERVTGSPLKLEVTSSNDNGCKGNGVVFRLSGTHAAGPQIDAASFTVSAISGATIVGSGTVSNNGTFQFNFANNGANGGDAVFEIGMNVTLQPGTSGAATWNTSATVQ